MIAFSSFFSLTVVLLMATAWTGKLARRRVHLSLVVCTISSLATTIYYAVQLGDSYNLESAGTIYHVHMFLARLATLSYIAPIVSGIATIRNGRHRALHGKIALMVIVLTVLAACTGVWMIMCAEKIAA